MDMTKKKNRYKKNQDFINGFFIILLSFLAGIISISVSFLYVNALLISVVFLGFFIKNINNLILLDMVLIILFKFSPFISYEFLFFIFLSFLIFFINKNFLFKNNIFIVLITVFITILIFGLIFGSFYNLKAIFLETFYDIIISTLLFAIVLWSEKKFS